MSQSLIALCVALSLIATQLDDRAVSAEAVAVASVFVKDDPINFTTLMEPADSFDRRIDKGTIQQVCFAYGRTDEDVRAGRLLAGAQAASVYMKEVFRWGGRGSLGQCRELLRSTSNRNCDGQKYPEDRVGVREPRLRFYSDCWSNHAQGRAVDIRVGDNLPGRKRIERGNLVIEWLLAPDPFGRKQARARRLGVQEIIFFDRCWSSNEPDDLELTTYAELDECDVGHYDHVHLSFTIAGALGLTSGYGPRHPPLDCTGCQPNTRPIR